MARTQPVLLATSRRPTTAIRTLCRDLSYILPNIVRTNRGKLSLEGVAEKALEFNAEKVMLVDRWEKGFGKMEFFEIEQDGLKSVPPTVYLNSVRFRRDFGEQLSKGKRIDSIAITSVSKDNEVVELEKGLSSFFAIPAFSFQEAVDANYDSVMQIWTERAKRIIITFKLVPKVVEIGPRIETSRRVWESE